MSRRRLHRLTLLPRSRLVYCLILLALFVLHRLTRPFGSSSTPLRHLPTPQDYEGFMKELQSKLCESLAYSPPRVARFRKRAAVFSIYTDSAATFRNLSGARNKAYAELHGYAFFPVCDAVHFKGLDADTARYHPKAHAAAKLQKYAIARVLLESYNYVLFVDADAAIFKCGFRIPDFINDFSTRSVFLLGTAKDAPMSINMGSFILKSTAFAKEFLQGILDGAGKPPQYPIIRLPQGLKNTSAMGAYTHLTPDDIDGGHGAEFDEIVDQKVVIDLVAGMPFSIVDANIAVFYEPHFETHISTIDNWGIEKATAAPDAGYIIHTANGGTYEQRKNRLAPLLKGLACENFSRRGSRIPGAGGPKMV